VIRQDNNTIKLAESYAKATASTAAPIDINTGTGAEHKLTRFHETIDLGVPHGFQTGDAVVYSKGGENNTAIGGLEDGETYYVVAVEPSQWTFDGSSTSVVDTSDGNETIDLGAAHGLRTGDSVIYDNGGGGDIGGLDDGKAYYVITVDGQPTKVKLATTASNAEAGTAIGLTGAGTGITIPLGRVHRPK